MVVGTGELLSALGFWELWSSALVSLPSEPRAIRCARLEEEERSGSRRTKRKERKKKTPSFSLARSLSLASFFPLVVARSCSKSMPPQPPILPSLPPFQSPILPPSARIRYPIVIAIEKRQQLAKRRGGIQQPNQQLHAQAGASFFFSFLDAHAAVDDDVRPRSKNPNCALAASRLVSCL